MARDVCADCTVRDLALCSALSDGELARLNAVSRRQRLARGATLMWAGDASLVCGNLLTGVLRLTATAADGREQIVGLLYPPDFVGRPTAGALAFSVTALSDCELCVFPREPFERLLEDHPRMARLLLARTMAALDEARARILLLARGTAEEKLAAFLLETIDRARGDRPAGAGDPVTIALPLSRGQIADVLGLTIETVSRQMTQLRAAGIVALRGGRAITLFDRGALERRAIHA